MSQLNDTITSAQQASADKNWPLAASLWQKAIDEGGQTPDNFSRLARALRQLGALDQAKASIGLALKLDPANERALREDELITRGLSRSNMAAPGDVYHGGTASSYQKRREGSKRWQAENVAVEALLDRVPRGSSVLDIPFGTGRFAPAYHARAMSVTGVDISEDMLAAAMELYSAELVGATLETGDATALKYPDNNFDVCVSIRFLQNIIPYAAVRVALKEFARVTRSWAIVEFEIRKDDAVDLGLPPEDAPIRGLMYDRQVVSMLEEAGMKRVESRQVYDHGASVYAVMLCEVV